MLDLMEGVLEEFAERQAWGAQEWTNLRMDTWLARDIMFETAWLAEAGRAPGCASIRCPACGEEVVTKPGVKRPIHMGKRQAGQAICRGPTGEKS